MFGVDTMELFILAIVALVFIGPKELPRVMMTLGRFIGKVRAQARYFTAGVENMMREAELQEMEKKWREENERIMRQFPSDAVYPEPSGLTAEPTLPLEAPGAPDDDPTPPRDRPLP